ITDIQTEWQPRAPQFWMSLMEECKALGVVIQSILTWMKETEGYFPSLLALRLRISVPSHHASKMIGAIELLIASYVPVCQSLGKRGLKKRQRICNTLCTLVRDAKASSDLLGERGQAVCLNVYQELSREQMASHPQQREPFQGARKGAYSQILLFEALP